MFMCKYAQLERFKNGCIVASLVLFSFNCLGIQCALESQGNMKFVSWIHLHCCIFRVNFYIFLLTQNIELVLQILKLLELQCGLHSPVYFQETKILTLECNHLQTFDSPLSSSEFQILLCFILLSILSPFISPPYRESNTTLYVLFNLRAKKDKSIEQK